MLVFCLGDVNSLGLEDEELDGVYNAVDTISELRQSESLKELSVGRRIVVIGSVGFVPSCSLQTLRITPQI